MDKTYFRSTDLVKNLDLNFSGDVSCRGVENPGGKISAGFRVQKTDKGQKIVGTTCGGLKVDKQLGSYPANTELNSICDCEIVQMKNGTIQCPKNKFMRTFYPLLGKASCCSPCTDKGDIKAEFDREYCSDVYLGADGKTLQCPDNSFANSVYLTQNTAKLTCCAPVVGGKVGEENMELKEACEKYGVEPCTQRLVDGKINQCIKGGVQNCDKNTLQSFHDKCDKYGLRYETADGNIVNPTAKLDCHEDTFEKLDSMCKDTGIKRCSLDSIRKWKFQTLNNLVKNVDMVDKIQEAYNIRLRELEGGPVNSFIRRNLTWILLIFLLALIAILVTLVQLTKKK